MTRMMRKRKIHDAMSSIDDLHFSLLSPLIRCLRRPFWDYHQKARTRGGSLLLSIPMPGQAPLGALGFACLIACFAFCFALATVSVIEIYNGGLPPSHRVGESLGHRLDGMYGMRSLL